MPRSENYFSPFPLPVDGMNRKMSLVILTTLNGPMSEKLEENISHIRGLVIGWISIAIVSSYLWMIHGDFLPWLLRDQEMELNLELGLVFVEYIARQNNFERTITQFFATNITMPSPPHLCIAHALSLDTYQIQYTGAQPHMVV